MNKHLSFLLFFCFSALYTGAQSRAIQVIERADSAQKVNPANYRVPLDTLRNFRPSQAEVNDNSFYYQVLATYHSLAGNYDSALYYFDKPYETGIAQSAAKKTDEAFVKDNYFKNALSVLPKKLEQHKVVMLNEAHHIPAHRAFAISMLDELYRQGFRHIALETLSYKDTAQINKRGYPVQESGYYQKEPLYGELMRQALRKGFKLVAYESEVECPSAEGKDPFYCSRFRDSIQAQNLARWVKRNPGKKLFVYAGYDHIHEQPKQEWKHMAQFFREQTGINPYTIDQAQMMERFSPQIEDPRYAALTNLKNIQFPMVAYVDDTLWSHSNKVDVTIFHPRYQKKSGSMPRYAIKADRPDFYLLHNQRKPILITREPEKNRFSSELLPEGTSMIMAFYKNESGNRIPADVVELKKGQAETILFLYPATYEVVYLNEKGKLLMSRPMVIK